MKKVIIIFAVTVSIIYLHGCSEEIINPLALPSTDGAYILSEGTTAANSKLSFYSVLNDSFYQSIYGGSLAYPDGLMLYQNSLYLAEQGPAFGGNGKLYKLDSAGHLLMSSNPFGASPYSLAIINNKVFVTNGPGSNVSVLDLNSLNLITTIGVGVYPQEIIASNNKVYVCNTSAFGGSSDSTVSVIDAAANTVLTTLQLRKDPTSITKANEVNVNDVYVGCQGGGGMIYKIDGNTLNKLDSFSLTNGFDKDMIYNSGIIYYISALNNIDKLDLAARTVSTVVTNPAPGTTYIYGYNFDKFNFKHYVLDAKNFQVNGSLNIYNGTGTLEKTFNTGVGPRRVVFKFGTVYGGS